MRSLVAWMAAGFLVAEMLSSSSPSRTKVRKYVCLNLSGVPTTLAIKADGEQIPVFRWTSILIDSADWNIERTCKEVSARLDTLNRQERVNGFIEGRNNGRSVICTAFIKSLGCDRVLFSLKPWQKAISILGPLQKLHRLNAPLHETNTRSYVSIDELLSTPQDPAVAQPLNTESPTF